MRKVLIAFIVSVFIFALLATGCSRQTVTEKERPRPGEQTPAKAPSVAEYFPLTQGSTWEYQGEGNEYASFTREVIFTGINHAQMMENNGGTVLAVVFEAKNDSVIRTYRQGEVYEKINLLDRQPNDNTVILKGPIKVGTKWEGNGSVMEIADISAVVDTPVGKFDNCVKVKITYKDSSVFEYYKVGVGMVKREFVSGDSRVSSTLKKYKILQ
ncbi:MAG: hypothetical protein ACYDG4_10495 [Desulfuromonadaceae bacterium]